MTPQEHQRVKELFLQAIDLSENERGSFVRKACDDELIRQEVLSLLDHHEATTILPEPVVNERAGAVVEPATDHIDPDLVLSDVWNENRQILRRRLLMITIVLGVITAFSILRLFTYSHATIGYGVRILGVSVNLACAIFLYRYREMTLKQLRWVEFLVLSNIGLLASVLTVRLMLVLADEQDAVSLISVNNWNYFVWTLVILCYGVLMPNTWQRAATILLPIALMPTAIATLARTIDPQVSVLLQQDDFGMPIPAPLLAACIGIYAAHSIHSSRLSAFQAKQLAQYRLVRQIGKGGMGDVYEAEHVLMKRICAIKTIDPDRLIDPQALERFEREARATAELTHPHTIAIYDYGQTIDGVFFYVMELLPGLNLQELVRTAGPLPPERAVHFLRQACEALSEAHEAGLIHRDIKPANIFASERGGIRDFTKLLDFGLVQMTNVDLEGGAMASNMIAGTPHYMSPEQITAPQDVDARSDVYSLGAVGYFLLTGRPPFDAAAPIDVMMAHINQPLTPAAEINAQIGSDLDAILTRCLAKDAEQRYPDAKSLHDDLRRCSCRETWNQERAVAWWTDMA